MATWAHDHSTPPHESITDRPAATDCSVTVGIGRISEIRSIARLHQRCFPKSLAYRASTVLLLRLAHSRAFLVARAGNAVVGLVIGDYQSGQSRVITICVDPDWRQQGVGSQLLSAIETALPNGNMILMVEATNAPAQLLYRAHGFLAVGESRNYYGRGRHGIWMQKPRP
jgi:ribosomal-protein-alanine N-acetyltransferase